jgi:hypothetical protein
MTQERLNAEETASVLRTAAEARCVLGQKQKEASERVQSEFKLNDYAEKS